MSDPLQHHFTAIGEALIEFAKYQQGICYREEVKKQYPQGVYTLTLGVQVLGDKAYIRHLREENDTSASFMKRGDLTAIAGQGLAEQAYIQAVKFVRRSNALADEKKGIAKARVREAIKLLGEALYKLEREMPNEETII